MREKGKKRAFKALDILIVCLFIFGTKVLVKSYIEAEQRVNACYMLMYGELEDDELAKECWPYDYE